MPRPTPLPGTHGENLGQYRLQLLAADLEIDGQSRQLALVLKKFSPNKAGEHYFYRFLAPHLPVYTPLLIAGDDKSGWLVTLAPGQLRGSEIWDVDDYRAAIDNLAMLHDRYWGLQEDLENFDNLKHPLGSDYEKVAKSIQESVSLITIPSLAVPRYLTLFQVLLDKLQVIAELLQQEPFTLLHGSYWPDNIASPQDRGRQQIAHWQQAAIGPAVLDVVIFAQQTNAYLKPAFPMSAALARYRVQLASRRRDSLWNDQQWKLLWDYALLWLLLADYLPWITALTPDLYATWHPLMQRVWYEPAAQIVESRFGDTLPL